MFRYYLILAVYDGIKDLCEVFLDNCFANRIAWAFMLAVILLHAPPHDTSVLVRAVPGLRYIYGTTFSADEFSAKKVTSVTKIQRLSAFQFFLHMVKDVRPDDGRMAAMNIVLLDFAFVLLFLFG